MLNLFLYFIKILLKKLFDAFNLLRIFFIQRMPIHAYQHHEEYGTTFTNKDHDRNPLTKLQLENRLQIEEIPLSKVL